MSFFDNPKNFGLAAVIIGIVSLITGIVNAVNAAIADPMLEGALVASVGTILYGILILGIGLPIYRGEDTNTLSILGKFVRFVGVATIVVNIFIGAGQIVDGDTAVGATTIVVGLILGLILIWIAGRIVDGKVDTLDRIVWIILVVVFLILTIFSLVGIFTAFMGDAEILDKALRSILSLCEFILYIFLLIGVLSDDVKTKMGM